MSNTDSFIEEVSEEVRKDALFDYAKKYGWILVLIIVGAVGYTAYSEFSKSQRTGVAEARGDQILAALEQEDANGQASALAEVDGGPASDLVELQRAAALVDAEKTDEALAVLDAVASGSEDALYRDLAAFKAVVLRGASMPVADRRAELDRLSAAGAPFRSLALEQLALISMSEGKTETAIEEFLRLLEEPTASNGLRQRVQQMVVALGGELPSNPRLLSPATEN